MRMHVVGGGVRGHRRVCARDELLLHRDQPVHQHLGERCPIEASSAILFTLRCFQHHLGTRLRPFGRVP